MSVPHGRESGSGERLPRICFVGLYAYSLFNRQTQYIFGGAEVRSYLFSTGLAKTGRYDVSYVVLDWGQPRRETFEGVTIIPHSGYRHESSWLLRTMLRNVEAAGGVVVRTDRFPYRRLRTADPRLLLQHATVRLIGRLRRVAATLRGEHRHSLHIGPYEIPKARYRVYDDINADVYCVFGVSNLAGELAAYCQWRGKACVLFVADITNLDAAYQHDAQGATVYSDLFYVCRHAIDQADLVVTQTASQLQLLRERFGRNGVTIRNPINTMVNATPTEAGPHQKVALWIGRADGFKKMPLLLIRLAWACPEVRFVMVMNPQHSEIEEQVRREKPSNVTLYRGIPYDEIDRLFSRAFVFISTSLTEGFPNTFLQAGKYAVPVLSLHVDPDQYIRKFDCGIVAGGDLDLLAEGLRVLQLEQWGDNRRGRNHRAYVERYHALDDQVSLLDNTLQQICARQGSRAKRRIL